MRTTRQALPASGLTLPALGDELQKMLAAPQPHTIGEAAIVIERLLAELRMMQDHISATRDDPSSDDALEALFAAQAPTEPLSTDQISTLADTLEAR
jgi:hypothetical protein